MIIPDKTTFIQLALFVIFLLTIRALVFRPFLALLESREARTRGTREKAIEIAARFETRSKEYERSIAEAQAAAVARRQSARDAGAAERDRLLGAARGEIEGEIERSRDALDRETVQARTDLSTRGRDLSLEVVRRVVGRDLG